MDSSYGPLKIYPDSAPLIHAESKECFICREGDEMGRDALLHFCDCKNLIAHQKCLLTWIQKGFHNENVPRCKVCTAETFPGRSRAHFDRSGPTNEDGFVLLSASHLQGLEYELEKKSPWRILMLRWHKWIVFCTIVMLMTGIPLLVYQMIIAFKDPPPSLVFQIAAITFGALTEILLTKCLINYCSSNLEKARMSSFSIRARTV
nr:PREDICTED: uncharacterized protein LOC103278655 isoform X1 [Anolis carolinensis]|eukprot:XP_008107495.1 PREDICTED: uncharacterized protein LOC103278655 isoform X1 [Anolis carolinensis]